MIKKKVLIVEDDKDIRELLSIHLLDLDCEITAFDDGKEGLNKVLKTTFDLIILDVMLPGMDGISICREIRKSEIFTPIIMLTAKAQEFDKVSGLDAGADDYIAKPFSIREFIARVKAVFRRQSTFKKSTGIIQRGSLSIDSEKHLVTVNNVRIDLTPKEFHLLVLLAENPGKPFSREDLLNSVWGYEFSGYEHTVNSHVNRLRSKIEKDANAPEFILTSWGIGYRFNDQV